ncbi:hypothetical protein FACS1894207_3470 [Bacteroidia bacterium]|nr:hypothetical protein FACS1894207_3470 [Bacteroidia bacterium]
MNKIKNYILYHPHYEKAKYWGKLISITGTAQIIVQAVGFISGILVIRLLPIEEYALYTLANTMLGTMTVLSDGGISTGVMAQGGKVWQDKAKLGAVLATGLDLRRKFAGFSLLVSIPILCYLLLHHGASVITTILITASLIPAFYAALSDTLLQIPVKLHQDITPLQKNQVAVGVGRLILTGLTLFAFPWAFVAIIANGIPRIWGNMRLGKIADGFVNRKQSIDGENRREILKVVKRVLPGSIYYAVSGQITIWLISIFGQTTSIAQIGALGRFSVIFALILTVMQMLVVPRFSRMQDEKMKIIKTFILLQGLSLLIIFIMNLIVAIFSDPILWILGNNYDGLNKELLFIMLSGSVSFISMFTNALLSARGIVVPPTIFLTLVISIQILTLFLVPLNTVIGVILYSIVTTSTIYLIRLIYFGFQFKRV